jgi:hypothetical protein
MTASLGLSKSRYQTARACRPLLNILFRQLHEEPLTATPAPAIALNAADEPFAVVIDLDD